MPPTAADVSVSAGMIWHARQLLRAGGLAIGWPPFGLSLIAVCLFFTGAGTIDWLFGGDQADRLWPQLITPFTVAVDNEPLRTQISWQSPRVEAVLHTAAYPWSSLVTPLEEIVWGDARTTLAPPASAASFLSQLLQVAWALACWSLLGTAMCRSVAVMLAKDRSESFREAVQFAWPRWPSTIGAPAIPVGAILAIAVGLIVTAWFGRLPWIGTSLLTLASPLLLLAGLAIAFLALVIIGGWPLMVAAMGVEDCDGFGALSRSYSFLTGRPLRAVANVVLSALIGGVLVALVGGWLTFGLLAEANFLRASIGTPERWLTVMQWSHFFAVGLLLTFAANLFWSLATLNYLLLRQEVDSKPFDDIAAGPSDPSFHRDLPIVGIPATDYRPPTAVEQPLHSTAP